NAVGPSATPTRPDGSNRAHASRADGSAGSSGNDQGVRPPAEVPLHSALAVEWSPTTSDTAQCAETAPREEILRARRDGAPARSTPSDSTEAFSAGDTSSAATGRSFMRTD